MHGKEPFVGRGDLLPIHLKFLLLAAAEGRLGCHINRMVLSGNALLLQNAHNRLRPHALRDDKGKGLFLHLRVLEALLLSDLHEIDS